MQKVTCPQCRTVVEIHPDAPLCSVCSADLRTLLTPEATTRYFYQRAGDLAASGQLDKALSEVNRGLSYEDDSDLRLLGAILAKRSGDYTQMRSHVAAIPVDDVLRAEGEWLVRSLKEPRGPVPGVAANRPSGNSSPTAVDSRPSSGRKKTRAVWPMLVGVGVIAAAALAALWFFDLISLPSGTAIDPVSDGAPVVAAQAATPTSVAAPAPAENAPAENAPAEESTDGAVTNAVALEPTATPTETETPTPEATPTETPLPTPTPTPDISFDVTDYLMARGYPGLALLGVVGELEGGTLVVTGTVSSAEQRNSLVQILAENPNVLTLDDANLLLTLPATYTVEPGDSLWIISNRLYGDATYMDDIFLLNRDILPAPELLSVGMVLDLPPLREE